MGGLVMDWRKRSSKYALKIAQMKNNQFWIYGGVNRDEEEAEDLAYVGEKLSVFGDWLNLGLKLKENMRRRLKFIPGVPVVLFIKINKGQHPLDF